MKLSFARYNLIWWLSEKNGRERTKFSLLLKKRWIELLHSGKMNSSRWEKECADKWQLNNQWSKQKNNQLRRPLRILQKERHPKKPKNSVLKNKRKLLTMSRVNPRKNLNKRKKLAQLRVKSWCLNRDLHQFPMVEHQEVSQRASCFKGYLKSQRVRRKQSGKIC